MTRLALLVAFGWLIAIGLLAWLVDSAGVWNVLANTRLLDLLIELGVVRYHDIDLGIVQGIPSPELYLKSQDPLELRLLFAAFALYVAYWLVEAWRFRETARHVGMDLVPKAAERAWWAGTGFGRTMPFRMRDAAIETALVPDGGDTRQLRQSFALVEAQTVIFKILLFLGISFIVSGFGASIAAILPGFAILVASWLVLRKTGLITERPLANLWHAARALFANPRATLRLGGLAALAMLLVDLAPYLVAQAFTGDHVIMSVPLSAIQTAVVAAYIATRAPLTPKGLGQYEVAFALSLAASGVGLPEAASITLLDTLFRNLVGAAFAAVARRKSGLRIGDVVRRYLGAAPTDGATTLPLDAPLATTPRMPALGRLSEHLVWLAWGVVALYLLDKLAFFLMDYWLLEQLGLSSVFWTNFGTGALLFAIALALSLLPIAPVLLYGLKGSVRRVLIHVELITSLFDALWFSGFFFQFLIADGVAFGRTDPVFDNDIGFYVYTLDAWWAAWWLALRVAVTTLVSWVIASWVARDTSREPAALPRLAVFVGHVGRLGTRVNLLAIGVILAIGAVLSRYDVLFGDNPESSIFGGATYVDVEGLFSTVNNAWVLAFCIIAASVVAFLALGALHRRVAFGAEPLAPRVRRRLLQAGVAAVALAIAFPLIVRLRHTISVAPDQPVIQLPYIQAHIDATREAFGFNAIETIRFEPNRPGDPIPTAESLLQSPTLRNAPLWPGFCSYLEELVDVQHADRILMTQGDHLVYGPLLDVFRQQEKLRAYYDFLDIDTLRYPIDGERRMLVSAVREVPLLEPKPWLAWWGQRFMLFTHGLGLVTAHSAERTPEGTPIYVSGGIPVGSEVPALAPPQQRIHYGEGAGSIAYTNVRDMQELDYPTDEDRQTLWYPEDVSAGLHLDSLWKRLVFGYASGQFWEVLMSDLITDETRAHYFRVPLERAMRILPALHYDSDPFAFAANGRVMWMINAITHTDQYPFSRRDELGDKSDSRSPIPYPKVMANYVRDAVKVTVDAFAGEVTYYLIGDDPIAKTYAEVYPELFETRAEMPAEVRAQMQYPTQLLHIQFDDLYILYQMRDAMTFFNMEDMWDDADEVLGPLLDDGSAIRFSIEPFNLMVAADGAPFPRSSEPTQFTMALAFTPEGARNLRAIPFVYQDGDDYGRVGVLQVPKPYFTFGPEQADSIIDQDPRIAQELTWWTRRGLEVLRGHTTTLVVGNEVIYVEPLFLRSRQNPLPMMKRVYVVFRGTARGGETLEEALRAAIEAHRLEQSAGTTPSPAP